MAWGWWVRVHQPLAGRTAAADNALLLCAPAARSDSCPRWLPAPLHPSRPGRRGGILPAVATCGAALLAAAGTAACHHLLARRLGRPGALAVPVRRPAHCRPTASARSLARCLDGVFSPALPATHGSARFGTARDAAKWNHLAPAASTDAFALGELADASKGADRRFRQGGHVLTCAPTGAGKGIGAVIPNLLTYPGLAFLLDLKGENYAVTARARREMGQDVYLIDPFGITGARGQAMNWLDALDPNDPDVVSLSGALTDMLVGRHRRD